MQYLKKFLLIAAYRLIGPTIKLINDPWLYIEKFRLEHKSLLFCLWHEITAYCFYFYRDQNASALMEASKKGDVLAAMSRQLGYKDFRITDNPGDRTSVKGTIQFIKYLKAGHDGVVAMDGPNGPYHIPKPGALQIARKSDAMIIPLGVWYSKKIIFKSRWDKYQLPLPFSKCVLIMGEPFPIPEKLNDQIIKEKIEELSQVVDDLMSQAKEMGLMLAHK